MQATVAPPAVPWEGRPSYLRAKVTRGSAAGAHYSEQHVMLGYSARMNAISACGMSFDSYVLRPIGRKARLQESGIPTCSRPGCQSAEASALSSAR